MALLGVIAALACSRLGNQPISETDDPAANGALDPGAKGPAASTALTYHRDIKPLFAAKCGACHVAGGIAPFPLVSYGQVRAQLPAIRTSVEAGTMPPWPAADGCSDYHFVRALEPEQVDAVSAWIDAGAPEGDPRDVPVEVASEQGGLPRIDATLEMAAPYTPTVEPDDYRCFVLDWPYPEVKFVTGFRASPGRAGRCRSWSGGAASSPGTRWKPPMGKPKPAG